MEPPQGEDNPTFSKQRAVNLDIRQGLRLVFSRFALRKSVPTALIVGFLLNSFNQFPYLLNGKPLVWYKVCLNFAVPFVVSSYSVFLVC